MAASVPAQPSSRVSHWSPLFARVARRLVQLAPGGAAAQRSNMDDTGAAEAAAATAAAVPASETSLATLLAAMQQMQLQIDGLQARLTAQTEAQAAAAKAKAAQTEAEAAAAKAKAAQAEAEAWVRSNVRRVITWRSKFHVITRCGDGAACVMYHITRATSHKAPPHA